MEEIWKDVEDFEGLYQVSNTGKVRSIDHYARNGNGYKFVKGRERIPRANRGGYLLVDLTNGPIRKNLQVSRLVAKAFIPNPENLPEVNHRDEDKSNNYVSNLEWCARIYNSTYNGIHIRKSKNRRKAVLQYTMDGKFVHRYNSAGEAAIHLGNKDFEGNIGECCRHDSSYSHGFRWCYDGDALSPIKSTGLKISVYDENLNLLANCDSKAQCRKLFNIGYSQLERCLQSGELFKGKYYKLIP